MLQSIFVFTEKWIYDFIKVSGKYVNGAAINTCCIVFKCFIWYKNHLLFITFKILKGEFKVKIEVLEVKDSYS